MPLVRISLNGNGDAERPRAIGNAVHAAMVATMNVPADDRFQVITEHEGTQINYAPEYLGITHTDAIVLVQITLRAGRSVEQKRALYAQIAARLHDDYGVPLGDVIISLIEVGAADWSFGNGIAQYDPA